MIREARPGQVLLVIPHAVRVHVPPVPVAVLRLVVLSGLLPLHHLSVPVYGTRGPLAADLASGRCHPKESQSRLGLTQELMRLVMNEYRGAAARAWKRRRHVST